MYDTRAQDILNIFCEEKENFSHKRMLNVRYVKSPKC